MALYLQIPLKDVNRYNTKIVQLANMLHRTPSSVNFKMLNLASLDPVVKRMGKKVFDNHSKTDEIIWNRYYTRLDKLALDYEEILKKYHSETQESELFIIDTPGYDVEITTTARIGQNLFRKNVLAQYNYECCITGISIEEMLIASHIKPWAKSNEHEKIDSRNGLCMNPLHDKAFDIGLITINPDEYTLVYSDKIKKELPYDVYSSYFRKYENVPIKLPVPESLSPNPYHLKYHYDEIFIG